MAEYIDREDFKKQLMLESSLGHIKTLEDVEKIVDFVSATDVAPVKHEKWIDSPDGTTTICSYCEADWNVFDNDTYRFNYCPNCGSKMDLEE